MVETGIVKSRRETATQTGERDENKAGVPEGGVMSGGASGLRGKYFPSEEYLKPTYEHALARARNRLVCNHERVPEFYMAVIGSTLLANMTEEECLETIEKFLDSPVGQEYVGYIQDTEDP